MAQDKAEKRAPAVVWMKDYAQPIATEALYKSEEEAREYNGADFIMWPYKQDENGFIELPATKP